MNLTQEVFERLSTLTEERIRSEKEEHQIEEEARKKKQEEEDKKYALKVYEYYENCKNRFLEIFEKGYDHHNKCIKIPTSLRMENFPRHSSCYNELEAQVYFFKILGFDVQVENDYIPDPDDISFFGENGKTIPIYIVLTKPDENDS